MAAVTTPLSGTKVSLDRIIRIGDLNIADFFPGSLVDKFSPLAFPCIAENTESS